MGEGRSRQVWWGVGLAALFVFGVTVSVAPASASYAYPSKPFVSLDATQAGADVSCPHGSVAIAGGVSARGNYAAGIYVNTSRPGLLENSTYNGWTVYVDNRPGGPASNTPKVYAVCDKSAGPSDYKRRTEQILVANGAYDVEGVDCAEDEVVVDGGAYTPASFADRVELSSSWPVDNQAGDHPPDAAWLIAVTNVAGGSTGPAIVDVWAVCDKRHKTSAYRYLKQTRKVPDATQKSRAVSCPNHEAVIGGGVRAHAQYLEGLFINSIFPNQPLWSAAVDNSDTPDNLTRKITTIAICKR